MQRSILLWAGVALGLTAVAAGCKKGKPKRQFDTAAVDRGRLIARVTASGTVSALVTVQVGAQVSGTIQELFVDFNSPVKKDQVLAKIDPRLFVAAVEQARANVVAAKGALANAQAQERNAKLQFERDKLLLARQLLAQGDLDTARAAADGDEGQVEAAEGSLAQAQANLNQAETNLKYTTIISPIDGVVISRSVDVGQTVAASFQTPTLFLIAQDLKKMQVDTSVAESDVGHLAAGMEATFSVDAYPSKTFKGRVRQVRYNPQTVQNVVTYDAVLDVDNTSLELRPGMTANATFIYADRPEVLRLPNAALRVHPPADLAMHHHDHAGAALPTSPNHRTIWVVGDDGEPKPVRIVTGVTDGTLTEIVSGEVAEGASVVTEFLGGERQGGPPHMHFF
ncbi:MAG TPA: efflux RND transporter periplasmic adaptor subunit [Myxococcales bacterium]|nr:efflux RND transporter periplasmic adaptor subunit [Myxococcales bacterium]